MSSNDQLLRNFNTMITQLEGGALNEELSEKVRECIQEIGDACLDRGGRHKASLTLKLDKAQSYGFSISTVSTHFCRNLLRMPALSSEKKVVLPIYHGSDEF